jgi:hypothetical protein
VMSAKTQKRTHTLQQTYLYWITRGGDEPLANGPRRYH